MQLTLGDDFATGATLPLPMDGGDTDTTPLLINPAPLAAAQARRDALAAGQAELTQEVDYA